jgi:hypothetical protein
VRLIAQGEAIGVRGLNFAPKARRIVFNVRRGR